MKYYIFICFLIFFIVNLFPSSLLNQKNTNIELNYKINTNSNISHRRNFNYINFDGRKIELELNIYDDFYQQSIEDWTKYAKHGLDARANYKDYVIGLFRKNKVKTKFIFDLFENNLKNQSNEYILRTIIRFVQSIPYKIPNNKYKGVNISGLLPPAATLIEGYGDCDTKSLLFACIASHKFDIIFLEGSTHAFIGVSGNPTLGQDYVIINRKKYILCEMTSIWDLGKLPVTSKNDINLGTYDYIEMN
jgi:hypothetical protein